VKATEFNAHDARAALDGMLRQAGKCRRGRAYGNAVVTVTFANDGSVGDRVVGQPFGGTPTGACIVEALADAHVAPFLGKPGAVTTRVWVAPN
jgi:hypothetical protein